MIISCLKNRLLPACLFLLMLNTSVYAQKSTSLPRSIPEAEGVSSAGIDSFLYAAANSPHEFHSIMVLRHGKVIAEGWWNPYSSTLKHALYSTSKSFTSTAIGFLVSEKKMTVNDKVVSFFPNMLPDTISPYLAALTVKDLLTMSVGQTPDPTGVIPFTTDHWVKAFLALHIANKPGSVFLYNTMATYTLSAIVQKVSGQKEIDYLKPRLFDPLGITGEDWEISDEGVNTGGWGLRLKTEDLAKMGQFYLQKGSWNGKQLLPKEWVDEATTFKIDQAPGEAQSKKDSSDWKQGYCYQFWRCRNNAFRADGAFGQYIIVMPDKDAVVAITCETKDMQGEINLVWKYLLPAIGGGALPANKVAAAQLKQHLAELDLPALANTGGKTYIAAISGKTFMLQPNDLNIKSIFFNDGGKSCQVALKKDTATYYFSFSTGKWLINKTNMQGPSLLLQAKEDFSALPPYAIADSYNWPDEHTLQLKIRYIESPHSEMITCHFSGNTITATVEYSFNYGSKKIELKGEAVN